MARVSFISHDRSIEVGRGTTILEAARRAGIEIESPCNGTGKCGKCRVIIGENLPGSLKQYLGGGHVPIEDEYLSVLACGSEVRDDMIIYIPERSQKNMSGFLTTGKTSG
jgi:uncharacterized 2Fe-2S/4Fe-4S cluster protein (DUF4445 family)